jgi:RNA polymerase sigma-70 factor, ECF subfamily
MPLQAGPETVCTFYPKSTRTAAQSQSRCEKIRQEKNVMVSLAQTQPNLNTARFAATSLHPTTSDSPDEIVLLERCKSGDKNAWNTLIHRSERSIYKFAYSLCRSHEEAGDIVGQVFLRLYQNLHTFRHEASFTSWLFRIVRNTYLDLCIRPAHRSHLSLDAGPTIGSETSAGRDILDPAPTPEAVCLQKETTQMLSKAIQHLPAYQRQVLRMYHTEGKSYEEIAAATGLSIGTVKSRLNRARTMLRERLAPFQETLRVV